MRAPSLSLAIFLGAVAHTLGLRLRGDDDPISPFWGSDKNETVTLRSGWSSTGDQEAAADVEPGECQLGKSNDESLATYLTIAYSECVRNNTLGVDTLPALDSEGIAVLKPRFARPKLVYSPYITSLPVFYVSRGGKRERCFRAFLENFSMDMHRIEAVMLAPDDELMGQLSPVVEDPMFILQSRSKYSRTPSGDYEWRKRWGCLLAHLYAVRLAYERNKTAAIILEDDAVPLYGSWTTTLEEFLLTLPSTWQAVQLQWSLGRGSVLDKRNEGASSLYARGSGWGTTAYAIHRRGMEALMSKLYNPRTRKFIVQPLVHCSPITADDCLLGFTPSRRVFHESRFWNALQHIYKATPPLFLHDSVNSGLHKRNYCQDLELTAGAASDKGRKHLANATAANGVLMFFAFGSSRACSAKSILKANLGRANGSDVFLVYADNFTQAAEQHSPSALKLKLLQQHWHTFGRTWRQDYDYVWAVNEDVRLQFGPLEMIAEADSTGALAVAPALVHEFIPTDQPLLLGKRHNLHRQQHSRCHFHFANYVDALAPMMPPAAWEQIFNEVGENSSFEGVDQMWCDSLQRAGLWHSSGHNSTACAILDGLVASHITDEVAFLKVAPKSSNSTEEERFYVNRGHSSAERYEFCVP